MYAKALLFLLISHTVYEMIQKIDVYIVDYMCKCVGCLSLYRVHRLVLDIFIGIDITQRKRWFTGPRS